MSSSFQNVVGTPRDAVPDISKTNYLKTSADMSTPVNEDSKERIKDTKDLFDQLIKIEELAAENTDKRLESLFGIVELGGDLRAKMIAKQADGLSKEFLKDERLKFQ